MAKFATLEINNKLLNYQPSFTLSSTLTFFLNNLVLADTHNVVSYIVMWSLQQNSVDICRIEFIRAYKHVTSCQQCNVPEENLHCQHDYARARRTEFIQHINRQVTKQSALIFSWFELRRQICTGEFRDLCPRIYLALFALVQYFTPSIMIGILVLSLPWLLYTQNYHSAINNMSNNIL